MSKKPKTPDAKRPWFQFSLRRLAASITLFAISFGAWAIFWAPFDERNGWHFGPLGILALLAIGIGSFSAAISILLFRSWVIALAIGAMIGIGWVIWFIVDLSRTFDGAQW